MTTHSCIKPSCGSQYESEDVDAYYCPPCNEMRKEIAKKIDAKLVGKERRPIVSAIQEYTNLQKLHGSRFVRVGMDGNFI